MRYWKKVWPGGEKAFIKKSLFSSPAARSMNLNEWADEESIHYTIYKTTYTMSYEGSDLDWSRRSHAESLELAKRYTDKVAEALGAKGEAEWVPDRWGWLR